MADQAIHRFRRDVALQYVSQLPPGFSCVTTITLTFHADHRLTAQAGCNTIAIDDHILHLQGGKLTLYPGGYDAFERQRAELPALGDPVRGRPQLVGDQLLECPPGGFG